MRFLSFLSLLRGGVAMVLALCGPLPTLPLSAQETALRELTVVGGDIPVRLMGYGLVVGLDGTGDRVIGGFSSGHTVRSVANLLRRFDVEVPENMLRTRNVAAVLVTAEASPYLRPGGRFEVQVASLGDATSLRGGVLWMTPLVADSDAPPVATAQGPLLVSDASGSWATGDGGYSVETTVTLPEGGVLEQPLPPPSFATASMLHLRRPELETAVRIAEAINAELGEGSALVADPGSVRLTLQGDAVQDPAVAMARIGALRIRPGRTSRLIIDGRSGTVVAGGGITVDEAVVSHGGMTLAIGRSSADETATPGDLRLEPGVTVQDVAAALHGVAAPPRAVASIFAALRDVGALTAEVTIR